MGQAVLGGDPPVEITLKRSARARRLSLRVSALDGRVTLSLPAGASEAEALAFARDKEAWIRRHLAAQPEPEQARPDGKIMYRGTVLPIRTGQGRTVRLSDGALQVPDARPAQAASQIRAFFKHSARAALSQASDKYAEAVGRRYSRITLRDTRSRWGSCSTTGALMYSWRLIMAPPEILDYVAAHEVAHLVEMNHSPAFWSLVARICPDYSAPRVWLRRNGASLHRYRFGD